MTINPPKHNRRRQSRRITDQITEDLHKTLSSSHCHTCLEHLHDAVLLLDNEGKLFYATSQMYSIINDAEDLFSLTPSFSLLNSRDNSRLKYFLEEDNNQKNPLVIQLTNDKLKVVLSLAVFRLPAPSDSGLRVAKFLVRANKVKGTCEQQWLLFVKQFALTESELRLCRALTNGLTIKNHSINTGITIHTARSHLKSIFSKTSTQRQINLLRLINLFM